MKSDKYENRVKDSMRQLYRVTEFESAHLQCSTSLSFFFLCVCVLWLVSLFFSCFCWFLYFWWNLFCLIVATLDYSFYNKKHDSLCFFKSWRVAYLWASLNWFRCVMHIFFLYSWIFFSRVLRNFDICAEI